jgi:hypothetical protein
MNIRIPRIIVFLLTDVQLHNDNRVLYYYFILLFSIIACFIKVFESLITITVNVPMFLENCL